MPFLPLEKEQISESLKIKSTRTVGLVGGSKPIPLIAKMESHLMIIEINGLDINLAHPTGRVHPGQTMARTHLKTFFERINEEMKGSLWPLVDGGPNCKCALARSH
ncbi:Uncharacterized protein TCM_015002 [Theobroma cacao]|uniref:Uncharacterized protein n=1 Tax=Theobroma cacao TaxID=3641 RepID=A0A061FZK4_THECC|nr:Uncharacterized protein TCM_015002 [Theobroma cacao]